MLFNTDTRQCLNIKKCFIIIVIHWFTLYIRWFKHKLQVCKYVVKCRYCGNILIFNQVKINISNINNLLSHRRALYTKNRSTQNLTSTNI